MDKMLIVTRRKLADMGIVKHNTLIVWGRRKKKSDHTHEFAIFAVVDGKLMVLPFVDLDNILYDQVEYYSKGQVSLEFSKWIPTLTINFLGSSKVVRYSDQSGDNDMALIVGAFNRGIPAVSAANGCRMC